MNAEQKVNQWGQIVAKAWQDDAFKKRLLADPAAVFKEQGMQAPAGIQLRVVENTDRVTYLTLPAKPGEEELSDEALECVAGGFSLPCVGGNLIPLGGGGDSKGPIARGAAAALLEIQLGKVIKELPKETSPNPA